jgi:hypothetical protein
MPSATMPGATTCSATPPRRRRISVSRHSPNSDPNIIAPSQLPGWLLDFPVAAVLFSSIWLLGMRQFGGYDHSAMIQAGWLQISSLVPFKDYPCTLPPLFFLGNRYAFLLFGVRWSAFVLLMAAFSVLSFFFLCRQLRALGFPAAGAASLAVAAEVGTCVVCSYWWHNPVTSVVAVMTFLSTLVCLANVEDTTAWALLGISFTLLVLSKPNAWPVGACLILLAATGQSRQRLQALTVLIAGVASAGIVCWLHGVSPLALLRTYSEISGTRGRPFAMTGLVNLSPFEVTILLRSTAAVVFLLMGILVAHHNEWRRYWREYACCLVMAVTSLAMAGMNYEIKTSDLMPLVVVLAVAAFRPWSEQRLDGLGRVATVMVTLFFVALSSYWGVTRMRVRGIGERMFFEDAPTQTIQTGFFRGLRSGPRLIAVLRQLEEALGRYPANKVFFGPRMEFAYAAFRREPPRGLPIWWHPGSSFAVSDRAAVSRALENDDFDLMVFLKNDRTRMPLAPLQRKLSGYEQVPGFSELDVYIRRKGA